MIEGNISSRLIYLPVTLEGRVQIWLTYKDLKPVSAIKTRIPFSKNTRLIRWLNDTGLKYSQDKKHREIIYVSKSNKLLDEISEIMWSEGTKDVLKKGRLFGYPTKAVEAFTQKDPKLLVATQLTHNEYWFAYARYVFRKDHINEDTKTAKKWAECIRNDVPILAKWFESALQKATIK